MRPQTMGGDTATLPAVSPAVSHLHWGAAEPTHAMGTAWQAPPHPILSDVVLRFIATEVRWAPQIASMRLVCRGWRQEVDANLPAMPVVAPAASPGVMARRLRRFPNLRVLDVMYSGGEAVLPVPACDVLVLSVPLAPPPLQL